MDHADIDHTGLTGSGIPATIVDAKGDIIAASAADTVTRQAVGSNSTMLQAASGQSTGLQYVLPFVGVRRNSAAPLYNRHTVNLIEGSGITLAVADDAGNDEVDVTITSTGGAATALQAGSATRTAGDITTTSTTFVDATGISVTITTGARRCLIAVQATGKNSVNGNTCLDIDIDGSRQGQTFGLAFGTGGGTAGENENLSFTFITAALTAASHTFKLQWRVDSGTGTLYASTGVAPLSMQVVELYAA